MITCGECGKINGGDKVGGHWICEDCKVPAAPAASSGTEGNDQAQKQ